MVLQLDSRTERTVMKFFKVVEERRSIRKYKDKPVEHDDLKKMISDALLAPSWKNTETPKYYVVTNEEKLASLKENCLPPFNARNCENAPCVIVCCFEKGKSGMGNDGEYANECQEGWGYYDLGLASENLVLAARALGLGTLIMGIRNADALRKLLSIPENEQIVSVISVGIPDIDPKTPHRKKVREAAVFVD